VFLQYASISKQCHGLLNNSKQALLVTSTFFFDKTIRNNNNNKKHQTSLSLKHTERTKRDIVTLWWAITKSQ